MQSPRSYGHFEIRLTYERLLVAKLRAFKKKYLEPAAISTSRLLQLRLLLQAVSFIKTPNCASSVLTSRGSWPLCTPSCTHPRGPSGHCLLGTLPCRFYHRSCSRSFPSPETQPDCITARHLPHILYQPTGSSKLHLLSPVHIQPPSPLPHN